MKLDELFKILNPTSKIEVFGIDENVDTAVPYFVGNTLDYCNGGVDKNLLETEVCDVYQNVGSNKICIRIKDDFDNAKKLFRKIKKAQEKKMSYDSENRRFLRTTKKIVPYLQLHSISELEDLDEDELLLIEEDSDDGKKVLVSCNMRCNKDIIIRALDVYHLPVFTTTSVFYSEDVSDFLEDVAWLVAEYNRCGISGRDEFIENTYKAGWKVAAPYRIKCRFH